MLLLKLCALCLATGAAAKSIASQVKESDVSPEGISGSPTAPVDRQRLGARQWHGPIPSQP